ncbi:MAG: (2Fe-2S) ferredoxin domain-containing protein [Synechococcus sp.]|nr:(2Fe-2S) ferredoxin domain-containing protein [Synechococcus sp.]
MTATQVSHHLLLCATPTKAQCCDPSAGAETWAALKQGVKALGLEDPQRPQGIVLRTKADCLRVCSQGPVLLIWPDGCWYGAVTPERIDTILREHVIGGRPIEPWLIQRSKMEPSQATAS